jgi:hypothetical protein
MKPIAMDQSIVNIALERAGRNPLTKPIMVRLALPPRLLFTF